jgi:hypothetical protein
VAEQNYFFGARAPGRQLRISVAQRNPVAFLRALNRTVTTKRTARPARWRRQPTWRERRQPERIVRQLLSFSGQPRVAFVRCRADRARVIVRLVYFGRVAGATVPHESNANAAKSDIAITKQRRFMRPQSPFRKRNDSSRHYIEIQVAQHGVEPHALARPRGAREKPDRESELG